MLLACCKASISVLVADIASVVFGYPMLTILQKGRSTFYDKRYLDETQTSVTQSLALHLIFLWDS